MNTHIKRISIIALCLILVLLCACGKKSNTPAPSPPATPTAAPTPSATLAPTAVSTPPPPTGPIATTAPEPTIAFAGQVVCTADEFINIRTEADVYADIAGTLPAGETAYVIAYHDDWVHIAYNGIVGFVSQDYTINKHEPSIPVPMGDWAAILVSPTHVLPDGFDVSLADFENSQVDARIQGICTEMFVDAAEDGIDFQLVDAYRSHDRQSELFEEMVSRYTGRGYSRADAEVKAATITARPDTSEHQTGLALDIVTPSYTKMNKGFANTDAFKWLSANAANYGFTMRYKSDKVSITGVIYEPWHWRFVGVKAAAEMKQSGQCFEEYLGEMD